MRKRHIILAIIFVIIAGAIAGAFVFLGQQDNSYPAIIPGATGSTGEAGMAQYLFPVQNAVITAQSWTAL